MRGARRARCAWPCALLGLLAAWGPRAAEGAAEREPTPGARAELQAVLGAGSGAGQSTLGRATALDAARRFYAAREGALAWVRGNAVTPQGRALVEVLRAAGGKGLEPEDYGAAALVERLGAGAPPASEADLVRLDVALTVAAAAYAADLQSGRVEARRLGADLGPPARPAEPAELLARLADAPDVGAALESLEPPFAAYRRSVAALQRYLALAREPQAPLTVPRAAVHAGDPYPDAPRLAALLRRLGDLPAGAEPAGGEATHGEATYGGPMVEAVRRFQERHGLEPDGTLGARTLAALNTPLARRATQLALTLERWRSIPRAFAGPPIVVNVPEYRLRALDPRGRGSLSMKVVVGRAYRYQTPVLASDLASVVFRPWWSVPLRIQREELVPRLERDPAALGPDYQVVDGRGEVVAEGEVGADVLARLRAGSLRLRQRPGPGNALGLMKFVFPNAHDVYLHGTPSRGAFQRARRDVSHGCIRVEDPEALAAWVLDGTPGWTPARIRDAIQGERTLQIAVARRIPVLIVYGTAVVSEDGTVRFLEDVYGHDAALERALAERRAQSSAVR